MALSFHLANLLDSPTAPAMMLREVILEALRDDGDIRGAIRDDLNAILDRDSACHELYIPFLYFKGFQALQIHRIGHWLWAHNRQPLANFLQSQMSRHFGIDIHPAARFGHGIMLDHATGLVVGETAVVGNRVSILQSVTLGGTGKEDGDRHPKIGDGVLISAGAKILATFALAKGRKWVRAPWCCRMCRRIRRWRGSRQGCRQTDDRVTGTRYGSRDSRVSVVGGDSSTTASTIAAT
ncbi:MAG: hypothetical protein CM15mP74_15710 [Halieaceae bacterium]|nr:MAG: hypothetical protein CM15mP74_15710 [Halieaceae bacterium]